MTRSIKSRKGKKPTAHKPVDHLKQLPRLRRIEGQVRGLQQMVADERYCIDIVHQINAIIAALRRVEGDMLSDHVAACAESALNSQCKPAEARRLAEEVGRVLTRLR
ncbi:MAG TPA: metal-sensitive transcriptional regulator [Blastocatellia bacterium]|nr:metal-sensitive transcriptional regulator [Blastocatellia bacterium]